MLNNLLQKNGQLLKIKLQIYDYGHHKHNITYCIKLQGNSQHGTYLNGLLHGMTTVFRVINLPVGPLHLNHASDYRQFTARPIVTL